MKSLDMNPKPKIIIHLAGHDFHPVYDQAEALVRWLGPDYWCHSAESLAAFEHLGECDLLIFLGMYFTGWEGRYRSPGELHKRALERYISSSRPVILCHGAVVCYDDWPRFGQLVGFTWREDGPKFAPMADYRFRVLGERDPIVSGMEDYSVVDAPPCNVGLPSDMSVDVHCTTTWQGRDLPMVMTGKGGRTAGAGKTAFIGHGHDMRSFACPQVQRIWLNTIQWCLEK